MSLPNLDETSKFQLLPGTVVLGWPDGKMAKQANSLLRPCKILGEHKISMYRLEKEKYRLQAHEGDILSLAEEVQVPLAWQSPHTSQAPSLHLENIATFPVLSLGILRK